MKILYVGTELAEAQAIATAVNGLAECVRVSWTSELDRVALWIDENEGLRVLVVEAQPDGRVWRAVVTYAAGLRAPLPVVVIVPEDIASDLQVHGLDAHECVARNPSLLPDLPAVITRAIDRARQRELERAMRDMVHEQFREAVLEVERVRLRHASAVADGERLARREAELEARAAEEEQRHASLMASTADQFRELQAALNTARQELESTAAHLDALATREAELDGQIRQERASRAALEKEISDTNAALQDAQRRHDVALRAAASDLAERRAHFERERAQAEEERAGLTTQLRELEEARDLVRREHQSAVEDITRLTEREADLERRLIEERATRDTLEETLAGTAAALQDEQQRHQVALKTAADELADRRAHFERERADAAEERSGLTARLQEVEEARDRLTERESALDGRLKGLTEREAELEGRLKEERATRDTLEQTLAGTAAALQDEQQRHHVALKTAADELADRQAHFERERAEAEAERVGLTAHVRELEGARDQVRREHQSALADITRLTEREAELEGRLTEERATRDTLEQTLTGTAAALQDEQHRHDVALATAARERADLEARITATQEDAHRLDREHQAERERLEHALTSTSGVIQQLTTERQEIERRFEEARNALQALQHDLERSRSDNHRMFQQAPLPMFRCTKDGVLTQVNRMLTVLLGRRSAEELRSAELVAATFESPNDLAWLIERCLGSKAKESTETTWRRKDGSRLLVRLTACATSSDLIECGVEDLTPIRVLHDRLTQAHRMEAVGRLANEVAVTCGSLLSGIQQNAQQWLVTDGSHPASRQHGEMLLEEISRAAGLLRQLSAYGDEESRRPAVVELRTVVRDVAPILKRVAGDAVEVQLPAAASAPLNVDAGAERVKRLLVNLAAYGRERMPLGGQLKIELGTIVVDRHFAAKHPNVRLGPHALVTVTESRRATRTDGPLQLRDNEAGSSSRSVAVQTGVDLGTVQELVTECGGHLWMTVEPAGGMVVKIRLPLVTSYGEPPRRTSALGGRVRTLGNWLQH